MSETPEMSNEGEAPGGPDIEALVRSLRRKEGTWVEWGQACQQLQKAGRSAQWIFEETGFEPIHQNQVMVAAQVYASLLNQGISASTQAHYERKGSDILYELRILAQEDRAAVAELVLERGLDLDEAHEVARAVKEFSRLVVIPEGFTAHPGDAVAYQIWKLTRQKSDLQERSRLIAQGLKFAYSPAARQKIEQLLTDFTVTPARPAPLLPVYRLETDDEMPRLLPVVGQMPLSVEDFKAVPLLEEVGPFQIVKFSGTGAWIAIPGWQAILGAADPVAFLCDSEHLPTPLPGNTEEVMVVVDRAQRDWDGNSYFVVDRSGQLDLQWSEEAPELRILGRVIVVMRPKKILDEAATKELWQIDE
ncbi:hypothetical protein BST81_17095 [Leptolyngbya sp. 'hensonii']|uniref:RuBisCO accumulation factor 1 n=1 Tax=Leptolyngbya sp. 'hensonii' TaxID=1922337 RepID=UPI00094FF6BF|nr:RuBisCO accumulation factor 1 [Leptolyngbya sp. 'hensonii']OLP17075.1 hypothetical protein BST81_17095 [Leptolyngbya sp. 'hensonii']